MQPSQPTLRPRTSPAHPQHGGTLATVLAIIGGLVLACVVVTCVALWFVSRYIHVDVSSSGGGRQVEIETPFGGLKVRKADDIARELNLPVYPGAWPTDDSASVEFWAGAEDEQGGFHLTVAQYRTDDPLDKVEAWYREQLGPEFKREDGRVDIDIEKGRWRRRIHARGDGVAFIHERGNRVRGVGLERKWGGRVKIALFDVWEASEQ
ncbi:MAG: hypothetical protein ACE5MH_09715 [Terriglobia bacterium]